MNILDKIKKNWDFSKSTEHNCIRFSNEQEQKRRKIQKINKWLIPLIILIGIGLSILFNNPLPVLAFLMGAISFGSEYVFNSDTTNHVVVALLDSTHFVVCYGDGGNSGYGTAIIGTISSGNQISWGSEYVFSENTTSEIGVCALDSTHFVVKYKYALFNFYLKIGTISNGNEISFGNEYNNGKDLHCCIRTIDSTHFAICSSYGDNYRGVSRIGTVSNGNEISLGSRYTFESALTGEVKISILDSTHFVVEYALLLSDKTNFIIGTISNGNEISYGSKYTFKSDNKYGSCTDIKTLDSTHFVCIYSDSKNSNYLTAMIGTISNENEISFGDEYVSSYKTTSFSLDLLDSTHLIINFVDTDNSNYGTSIIVTISGGVISFSDKYVFNSATTTLKDTYSTIIIDSTHFVVCYGDGGNSGYGTAIVGTLEAPSTFIPRITWF